MKFTDSEFKFFLEKLPNGVWVADPAGFRVYFNEEWTKLTGKNASDSLGEGWIESIHSEDAERVLESYLSHIKARSEYIIEYRLLDLKGETRWVREIGRPISNSHGEYLGFLGICVDLSDRIEHNHFGGSFDSDILTGLLTKDRFRNLLLQEVERSVRYDSLLSLVYVDLDRFGEVNELLGFDRGNEVLRLIGDMVLYNIRGIDLACRYRGDVFVVALPETSIYDAEIVAERIREAIESTAYSFDGVHVRLRASIGLAQYSDGITLDNFIENAQKAKEHARKIGGNRVQKLSLF